ncbi:MAG: transglycosylase domain-containing protein [Breznakibacter sp.]|nr:transglycosylase domain-containing protein [Breznakibacter sp.]
MTGKKKNASTKSKSGKKRHPLVQILFFPSSHPSWKVRWSLNFLKVFMAGIFSASLFTTLVYLGLFGRIPSYEELSNISNNNASEVYTSDNVLMGRYFIENRLSIDNNDISRHVINALVATEDSRFFEHKGVDFMSIARVMFKTVLLGDRNQGGGSTISQQLAKNLYPRQSLGIFTLPVSKVKEIFIAARLEKIYSKEQILTLYLNTVPFGEDIYGIEAAAHRFFSRKSKWLEPPQAATLIGMLAANTAYNPRLNPEKSMKRRNIVLGRMAENGFIEKEKLEEYQKAPLQVKYIRIDRNTGIAPYFRGMVRFEAEQILNDLYGDEYNLYTDGLKIVTTINSRMQRYAEEAVKEHMAQVQKQFDAHWGKKDPWKGHPEVFRNAIRQSPRYQRMKEAGKSEEEIMKVMETPVNTVLFTHQGDKQVTISPVDSVKHYLRMLNTGFLVVHPQSGKILAWVGGVDHKSVEFDHVTSKRQVGSTFKPIVYAAAMMNGMEPNQYVANEKRTYSNHRDWSPGNSDGKYGGYYSIKGALARSINTVTAWIINQVGVDRVISMARKMGIESKIPEVASIALGTAEISLYEMVKAYTTFPNYGRPANFQNIVSITDRNGKVLYKYERPEPNEPAYTEDAAYYMVDMLQEVINSGTGRNLRANYGITAQLGGKTGTTQNNTDGWFVGFTPSLVAGAWVGADQPVVRFRTTSLGQGAYMAMPIFGRFMQKVERDGMLNNYYTSTFKEVPEEYAGNMVCEIFSETDPSVNFIERIANKLQRPDSIKTLKKLERDERRDARKEDREKEKENIFNKMKSLFKKKE